MIKYWQSTHDYKYFLTESKVHFDSSEKSRLHTELWKAWQKLQLFDTDKAMEFLLPFFSATGRPAKNQPQILRSFVLFFLLCSEGLAKPSLSLWVDRLRNDRLLSTLIGCTLDSLPPLGSYFDFMNRLWAAPTTDLYARDKLLPSSWNSKKFSSLLVTQHSTYLVTGLPNKKVSAVFSHFLCIDYKNISINPILLCNTSTNPNHIID